MSMAINQGWCIEAICDRCTYTEFLPYSKTTETEALLIMRGWRVGEKRLLCPSCKKALEQAEAQKESAKKGGRRLWRRR